MVNVFSYYKEKGNNIPKWGLTINGVYSALMYGANIDKTLDEYSKKYKQIADFKKFDEGVCKVKGIKWRRLRCEFLANCGKIQDTLQIAGVPHLIDEALIGYYWKFGIDKLKLTDRESNQLLQELTSVGLSISKK